MTSILIQNVTAITLDDQDRILHDVDIAIEGRIIVAIERNQVFLLLEWADSCFCSSSQCEKQRSSARNPSG